MTSTATDPDPGDDGQDQILSADARREAAANRDAHLPRAPIPDRLRRENVFNLRGTDAITERAKRAIRGGVRVGTADQHARLRKAQLGSDHMHDALLRVIDSPVHDPCATGVGCKLIDHVARFRIACRSTAKLTPSGRHIVVGEGERLRRPAHRAAGSLQPIKRVERPLMNEIPVDVQQGFAGGIRLRDPMEIPDLVKQRQGSGHDSKAFWRYPLGGRDSRLGLRARTVNLHMS